jgi:hypothetical protein
MNGKIKSIALFALCLCFGLSIFFSNLNPNLTQRDPAAVNGKYFQISSLSSEEIKNQINEKMKVFPTFQGKKSIQLGGFSSALCKNFPEIEIEFFADGVAIAGESPTLKVTSPCENAQDPSEIASILLPIEKLLAEKPRNAEYKFDGFNTKIEIKNAADEWPKTWILKSVHFKSHDGKRKSAFFKKLKSDEINFRPIVIEF